MAAVRGAALGALWQIADPDDSQPAHQKTLIQGLQSFSDPELLGDFLRGLFVSARETVQRSDVLLAGVNQVIGGLTADEFVLAAPALRLAFSDFSPREKYHIGRTLQQLLGVEKPADLRLPEAVSSEEIARALALEEHLFDRLSYYQIRRSADDRSADNE